MSSKYRHRYGYGGSRRADSAYGDDDKPTSEPKPMPPPKTVPPPVHHRQPLQPIARRPVVAPAPQTIKQATQEPTSSRRRFSFKKLVLPAVIVVVSLAIGFGFFLMRSDSPDTAPGDMIAHVISELSIQNDTNPAVLSVIDASITNQPFLEEAENGDKVLLFYKAKTSVLYRPSEHRIVKAGSFTPPPTKVFIRDGGSDDARLDEVQEKLKKIENIELVSQDQSVQANYSGIQIINVTGRYDDMVKTITESLSASTAGLPTGESAPDADILIIVGT